jgi:hypothetical protein
MRRGFALVTVVLAVALAFVAACEDDVFVCPDPPLSLRNPRTLLCESFHAPSAACPDELEPPTWATCGSCGAFTWDQAGCLAAPGCRPAYDNCVLIGELCIGDRAFVGCYGVDHAGPVAGACDDFDARDCSTRDDCAAWYQHNADCGSPDPEPRPFYQPQNGTCVLSFWGCRAEPTSPITVPPDPT